MKINENTIIESDICIVGGGISGLCAAMTAAEAGIKKIIILEKAKITGGNGRVSVGFFAAESPVQKRLGLNVSKDEIFMRFMSFAHWNSDTRLVRNWINKTSEMVAWLEAKGLKIIPESCEISRGSEPSNRWHVLWTGEGNPPGLVGKAIVELLTAELQKHGVEILLDTAGKKLIMNKGQVSGVIATCQGKKFQVKAKSVIIGTGGFAKNKDMLKKYFPLYQDNMYSHSLPQMTGDGLNMAEEIGADIDRSSIVFAFFGPHHYSWNGHLTYLHRIPEMIHVNKRGERYVGELMGSSFEGSNALSRQPGAISYTLFDSNLKKNIIDKRRPFGPHMEALSNREDWLSVIEIDLKTEMENSRLKIANSWDEIAHFMGTNPETLKATIDQYNTFCDKGYDADFIKDKQYLIPLRTPPYYALTSIQGFDVSSGGVRINHKLEALDKQHNPLYGLYVVGNDSGCVHSYAYTGGAQAPGCDLSFALCSGMMAGENAAKYVSSIL